MAKGKLIRWGIGIFIVFYILSSPHAASKSANGIVSGLKNAGHSLSIFVNGLGD